MRDEDTEGVREAMHDDRLDEIVDSGGTDFFGDFSVLGTGVHIVLNGRTVTSSMR